MDESYEKSLVNDKNEDDGNEDDLRFASPADAVIYVLIFSLADV